MNMMISYQELVRTFPNDLQQNQGGDNNMQHAEKRGVFMRKRIAKLFVHYLAIL